MALWERERGCGGRHLCGRSWGGSGRKALLFDRAPPTAGEVTRTREARVGSALASMTWWR